MFVLRYSQLSNKRPRSFINFWENFLSGRLILDRSFIFLWQMCHFRSGRLFILLYESGFFPTQVALILDRSFIFSSLVARRVVYLIRSSIEELRVHGTEAFEMDFIGSKRNQGNFQRVGHKPKAKKQKFDDLLCRQFTHRSF